MLDIIICTNKFYDKDVYRGISAYFRAKEPSAKIVLHTDSPKVLLDYLSETNSEGTYLVILSEFDDTFDIAKSIRATLKNSYIIFVSKNKPFLEQMTNMNLMLSGFVSYPLLDETFSYILDNVINYYLSIKMNRNTHLEIDTGSSKYFVPFKEIMYIAAEDKKTKYVVSNKIYFNRLPLKVIAKNLDSRFVRIHNSFIVNIQQVKYIDYGQNLVVMKDYVVLEDKKVKNQFSNKQKVVEEKKIIYEDELPISRANKKILKEVESIAKKGEL